MRILLYPFGLALRYLKKGAVFFLLIVLRIIQGKKADVVTLDGMIAIHEKLVIEKSLRQFNKGQKKTSRRSKIRSQKKDLEFLNNKIKTKKNG
ncbi:hypothetical protein EHQ53_14075 [Leptospira langatensis]|uniref:30S ribosomal protein S21 n=1 Tax=Leptospira langatensis TaxID=2484983 RepID=A0ABY2M989_9LEPT|nr:hypothetical protein [Leptospira langatensis]TGL39645.1 hypothetical protein EHQ53_14075 [Leptospira langatensis]